MLTVIRIYIISEILVINSRSSIGICLACSSPRLNFYYFCRSTNYTVFQDNDILSVLFLSKFLTRTFNFLDHSLPFLYPYPGFPDHSVSVLFPYQLFQIQPVLRTISVSVLRYGNRKGTESVSLLRGMLQTHKMTSLDPQNDISRPTKMTSLDTQNNISRLIK